MRKVLGCLVLGMATASVAVATEHHCTFDGKAHTSGAIVCKDGKQQQCRGGQWKSLGTSCARGTGHVMPGVDSPRVKHPTTPKPAAPEHLETQQPPSPS